MLRDLALTRFSMFGFRSAPLSRWDPDDEVSLVDDADFGGGYGAANWRDIMRVDVDYKGGVSEIALTSPHTTLAQPESQTLLLCGCVSCMKMSKDYDGFATGGTNPLAPTVTLPTLPPPTTPTLIVTDLQPGDTSTTATLTVDGPSVVASIDTIGDQDFFRVHLEEGQYYEIGQFLKVGGPSGVPLADAYIELYDAAGNLITSADGGGANTPSGLDALLTYQAQYTGDYFINARAFDNEAANGTSGDFVGDYEVFAHSVDPQDANVYVPRYSPDQPMHAIDWGTQIDRTSRNPDGDNGPRDNGAPDTGVTYNAQFDIYGKNVITYYFAKTGDIFLDENPATPGSTDNMVAKGFVQWEKDAFRAALDEYEKVTDNVYIEVSTREEADFDFITYNGTPGVGASLLGRMSPPNEENEGQMEINAGDVRWTQEGVSQGGFYFPTLLHELGHGHGMAHPHDNGGRSGVMPGADGGTGGIGGGYGDWGLSQQVFTVMSYNDGWNEEAPYGARPVGHGGPSAGGVTGTEADHYGWVGTLTALDIAVLQDKYGVNEEWATGNDVYTIGDENGPGNFYSCIWDAAGTDEIAYVGARDAYIDLRAATLEYEEGGGGWVSYAMGAWTGFTIANGVTIENASSGSGDDTLVGNDAGNTLNAGAGADELKGGGGDDFLIGASGGDVLNGGDGLDAADYSASSAAVTIDLVAHVATGGDAAGDNLISVEGIIGSSKRDLMFGGDEANVFTGNAGNDLLNGRGGDDRLEGGEGRNELVGGAGADEFVFSRNAAGGDIVYDFNGNEGDMLVFEGYGTAAEGATLTRIDATTYMINSADGLAHDILVLANGASVDANDYMFG